MIIYMLQFGISPNDITKESKMNLNEIKNIAKNKKVVAIGEIGLDYYWKIGRAHV